MSLFNLKTSFQTHQTFHCYHRVNSFTIEYEHKGSKQRQKNISSTNNFKQNLSHEERIQGCRLGLDSHADISCVGKHARILEVVEGQSCTVRPFNDSYKPIQNVQTVNAAFAVQDIHGHSYILVVNQALNFANTMEHSILCTNQVRHNEIIVDDIPPAVDWNKESSHSIYFRRHNVRLPLYMKGPVSFLDVRYPSDWELEHWDRLEITSGDGTWDPTFFEQSNLEKDFTTMEWSDEDPVISSMMMYDLYYDIAAMHKSIHSLSKLNFRSEVTPAMLSDLWGVGLKQAKRTLGCTTQHSLRLLYGQISRRVKTLPHQRMYRQLSGYLGLFASDTAKSNVISTRGNKLIQVFANKGNYVKPYFLKAKSEAHHALDMFIHDVGVPSEILTDNAKELSEGLWKKLCSKHYVKQRFTEPHSPWQNASELAIGIIKRKVRSLMRRTNTPARLWDYCWSYVCEVRALTASEHPYLEGVTPFEKVHGYSPNISEFIVFQWYEWVWYHDPDLPNRSGLGRWLGPAHDVSQGMAYHILTSKGTVLTRSTVHRLSDTEKISDEIKRLKKDFTTSMESVIGNYSISSINNGVIQMDNGDVYDGLFEDLPHEAECIDVEYDMYGDTIVNIDNVVESPETPDDIHDKLLGMKLNLPFAGETKHGTIEARKRNRDGTPIGESNSNPLFDTRVYEVSFGDGNYYDYSANVILENLYAQVDDFGRSASLLSDIIDHRKTEEAISKEDGWYKAKNSSAKKRIITTKGWEFLVEWKDGTSTWVPLIDLKEANPIELAEYSVARKIDDEPALAWWVKWTIKKKNKIINLVRARIPKKSMKFGIMVPGSVEEALELDWKNGNDLWDKAIKKELKNVLVAFKLLEDDELLPVGSKRIPYHIIFDVKFDLTRKARLVAGGHRNQVPSHATYSSVASRESVRLGFMLAGLNNLDIMACDIGNAYLNAPNRERVHVIVGKELFGQENVGKRAVIVRALYGLKSASAAWRQHFFETITQRLGYKSTIADPDVYLKPKSREDGTNYYSYLIIYVDDVLCLDINPGKTIEKISSVYRVKPDSIKSPTMYLGMDVRSWKIQDENGLENNCYALGANSYVKEAIRIIKNRLNQPEIIKTGISFYTGRRKNASMPFASQDYRPELDSSEYCDSACLTLFQNVIGMLRWICELGRVDILHETSILSQYLAQPRIGHLRQAVHIFQYLDTHDRSWMVMDPTKFDIDWKPEADEESPEVRARAMKLQYPDAEELVPHNAPVPLGEEVDINVFVDADHAGNKITRRSHSGILIYCNMSPISWYSKRQNTVETSTFSSEIIALRIATEQVEALRYKLRMFGVPLSGPARIFCDNKSVVQSTSNVEARLKKKHVSVSYGKIKSSLAASMILVYYENTSTNIADLLTKVLPRDKRLKLIRCILN